MKPNGTKTPPGLPGGQNGERNGRNGDDSVIDLIVIASSVVRNRWTLVRNAVVAIAFFAALAVILPKAYTARTVLLPPDNQEAMQLSQLFNQLPALPLQLASNRNGSELFVEILGSRAVGESVLKAPVTVDSVRTTLYDYWQSEHMTTALRKLYDQTTFATTEQGMIEIEVEMDRPEIAAQAANNFVAALDRVNQEKNISRARGTRKYIEEQVQSTKQRLQVASDSLVFYQVNFRAVALDEQARALLEQAGALKGQIIAKEVNLQMMQQTMRADNPFLIEAKKELAALQQQYEKLQRNEDASQKTADMLIPVAEVPQVAQRLAALTREVKAQETVWQLLTQQLYQAKIQEARDTPTVEVLDVAVPPEFATRPKPLLMTLVGTFVVLILSVLWVVFADAIRQQKEKNRHAGAWQELATVITDDWHRLRQRLFRSHS